MVDSPLLLRGLLYPQQNRMRNLQDISGIWRFQLDPKEKGEAEGWPRSLPEPRQIPVPCSWNELFDDARDYLGFAWYQREIHVPSAWQTQRVFLRIGSANYAAKVWVNGNTVAEHLGGHLPFTVDISNQLTWEKPELITILVENKQLPERVPPGPSSGSGGTSNFPATTYDFFPFSGLHRPVILYTVPMEQHIEDITVITTVEGKDGIINVKVSTAGYYTGDGRIVLNDAETDLKFLSGSADVTLRVPSAKLWSPSNPHLYTLTVMLTDGECVTDEYALDIGIRTIAVLGERLLLNGQPIKLKGFGKHEDFPLSGRGLNLPMWIRDYEILKWVGANSFRTSHYPYAEEAMQLADQLGILVINEIPAVSLNLEDSDQITAQRLAQAKQQLCELITRDKNHPSTIMWNVANQPQVRIGAFSMGLISADVSRAVAAGTQFLSELYNEAHRLDGTRPVTVVGFQGGPHDWFGLFDVVCVNAYYGWYTQPGQLELGISELTREIDKLHSEFSKPIIITEFGADAIPGAHGLPPEMWTEEYQVEFLKGVLDAVVERPFVVGTHVWAFADFKTGQSTRRAAAMNFKGVFTRDRRPKMGVHFLRSRWAS